MDRPPRDRARSRRCRAEPAAARARGRLDHHRAGGLPLAALGVVAYALDAFDISDPRMQPGFDALLDGLRLIALAYAFGRGLLAPRESNWRSRLGDRAAALLFRFLMVAASIWGVERLVEAAAERPPRSTFRSPRGRSPRR